MDIFLHSLTCADGCQTELLDAFTPAAKDVNIADSIETNKELIGFRNAAFTWSNEVQSPGTPGSSRRNFTLRIDQELIFKKGKINLVVGPTGCGKTSILMALLSELHFVPSGPDSWVRYLYHSMTPLVHPASTIYLVRVELLTRPRSLGSKTKRSGWVSSSFCYKYRLAKHDLRKTFYLVPHLMKSGTKRSSSSVVLFVICPFLKQETKQKSARRGYLFPAAKKHVSLWLEQSIHRRRSFFLTT